jgi:hypothetical protein
MRPGRKSGQGIGGEQTERDGDDPECAARCNAYHEIAVA